MFVFEEDLALEVGGVDGVGIDEADFSDSGGGEVEGGGGAESATADDEDGGLQQFFLPGFSDLGEEGVAEVAVFLLRGHWMEVMDTMMRGVAIFWGVKGDGVG